jgi:hypothetical protein
MKGSILWDIMLYRLLKSADVEEYITSIFRVEEKGKQETSMKQAASKVNRVQKPHDFLR